MNKLEKQMISLLDEMKDVHGVVELKTEFESEGARLSEVMRLKEISSRVGLGLIIKIGGGEAVRDLFDAVSVGVSCVVAPMIESSYALSKFLQAISNRIMPDDREDIRFGVNIETELACKSFSEMMGLPDFNFINTVTVGRVDLSGSLGLSRRDINGDEVFQITKEVLNRAKSEGNLDTTLGGGITPEAVPFITRLIDVGLLDRFETRKVVFDGNEAMDDVEEALRKANQFELLWLENKRDIYSSVSVEDNVRIDMLKKRS